MGYGKRVYDAAPDARPAPSDEAIVTGGVGAKMIRQIAPRCSGAQDPEYAIEDTPVVYPRNATWLVRQHGPDGNPFMISEFVVHDSSPQFWKFESRRSGQSQRFRLSAGRYLRITRGDSTMRPSEGPSKWLRGTMIPLVAERRSLPSLTRLERPKRFGTLCFLRESILVETGENSMDANSRTIKIGQSEFGCPCHACAFFNSRDEEYELLLPFSKSGAEAGERLFQVVDKAHLEERRLRLAEAGIDVPAAESNGQLEIRPWENAYLRGNRFDQNAMLELIQEVLKAGRSSGFPLTRLWANMEWALDDLPGVHDIVEYETRLNHFLPNYNDVVVCTYDLSKFSAPVVMDIMRTHPQVIVGGLLQTNPFYVPPDQFLAELSQRRH